MLIQNRKQGFYFILTVSIAYTKSLYPKLWALVDLWFTTHKNTSLYMWSKNSIEEQQLGGKNP